MPKSPKRNKTKLAIFIRIVSPKRRWLHTDYDGYIRSNNKKIDKKKLFLLFLMTKRKISIKN